MYIYIYTSFPAVEATVFKAKNPYAMLSKVPRASFPWVEWPGC